MQKRTFCQMLGALIFGGSAMAQSVAADSKNTVAKMRVAVVYFSRSGNTASVAKATGTKDKELFKIPGATHIQTYYVPEYVNQAVDKLKAFFGRTL